MTRSSSVRALQVFGLSAAFSSSALAHEMRPSHLELAPRADGNIDAIFRVALSGDAVDHLHLSLSPRCHPVGDERVEDAPKVVVRHGVLDCGPEGLAGLTISVDGLRETATEVVVSTPGASFLLRADSPSITLPAAGAVPTAWGWLQLGVEHITTGPDHLAFVLGLWLLVGSGAGQRTRRSRASGLLLTLTTFTLAHSITLGLAALGFVTPALRVVEAVIATSILILARELSPTTPSDSAPEATWARRAPWVFALVCGLLHGFGFAGALSQIGLPQADRVSALLLFNVGVELGQIGFVLALEALRLASRPLAGLVPRLPSTARAATVFSLGAVSAFWLLERTITIFTQ